MKKCKAKIIPKSLPGSNWAMSNNDKQIIVDTSDLEFMIRSPGLTRGFGTVSFSPVKSTSFPEYVRLGQGNKLFREFLMTGPSKGEFDYVKLCMKIQEIAFFILS